MQFIKRKRKLVFAFGNPLETDNHIKTEGGAIMMGKYWKRKMDSVLAEYNKWRIFYKHQKNGKECEKKNGKECEKCDKTDKNLIKTGQDDIDLESMITDADFFVDAIFNSLESQPSQLDDDWSSTCFTNSDFIQPGLIHLQPNIDDLMEVDPMVAMPDWFSFKQPDPYSLPVRRKSLTPDQDVFNQRDTAHLEIFHPPCEKTDLKTDVVENPPCTLNLRNNPEMQQNSKYLKIL